MNRYHALLLGLIALIAVLLFSTATYSATTAPVFAAPSITVAENGGSANLIITKSAKANSYSKIQVETVDGSAKAGIDYVAVNKVVTIANSTLRTSVLIPIFDNATYQGNRTFTVRLTILRFGQLAGSYVPPTVTINDDEAAPPPPPPPSSGTPVYGDTVVATKACVGSYDPDALIVGRSYKVVGMAGIRPAPGVDPTENAGVILNPIPDDGVHRGDGWMGLWVLFECVSLASVP